MMRTVGIYRVGYVELDLKRACRSMNRAQSYFCFLESGIITSLGDPDLSDYGYSDERFAELLSAHAGQYDFMVAITSVPIEGNYFTRTLEELQAIIITNFQAEELLVRSGRSAEELLAVGLSAELASLEFQRVTGEHWSALFHQDPRGCIFDFAGVKAQAVGKLQACEMCQPCHGRLAATNMDQRLVQSVRGILAQIRKPSLRKAVSASLTSPRLAFVYGGIVIAAAVNVLTGLVLADPPIQSPSQAKLAIGLVVGVPLFPVGVYGWHWMAHLRSRLR